MDWEYIKSELRFAAAILAVVAVIVIFRILEKPGKATTNYLCAINDMKSGDVVLLPYNSIYGYLIKMYGGTCWSHAGLVLCETDPKTCKKQTYIVEMATYYDPFEKDSETKEDKNYKGVLKIPIERWLRFNTHRTAIGHVRRKEPLNHREQAALETAIQQSKHKKINMEMFGWLTTLVKIPYIEALADISRKNKRVFCTELVVQILQDAGLVGKRHLPRCYTPAEFTKMKEFENHIRIFKPPALKHYSQKNVIDSDHDDAVGNDDSGGAGILDTTRATPDDTNRIIYKPFEVRSL